MGNRPLLLHDFIAGKFENKRFGDLDGCPFFVSRARSIPYSFAMLWQFSSPLLLFPEWIVFVLIGLQTVSLILWVLMLAYMGIIRRSHDEDGVLAKLREDYSRLWDRHEALRQNYADLWREHQETCDVLGPLLPEDTTDIGK